MDATIRQATPADVPAIARTWYAGWREAHLGRVPDALVEARTEETFGTRALENVAATTVAERDGEVVGFVVVAGDEHARRFYERCGWVDEGDFVHDAPGGVAVPARRYTRVLGQG